ncbi:MAG: trk system potassium uptake protein TrkH [Candidatus Nanohaloarchaea archaeon]|jgi:trk system potassium uptake protein TrkH
MRNRVSFQLIGSFLQIFGFLLVAPVFVGLYYGESYFMLSGFVFSAVVCVAMGATLERIGVRESPSVREAMYSTVLGWFLAICFGAIPFLVFDISIIDALFEASAGLTTTGISMFAEPEALSKSMLFWRSFMQWIGGLGILTFFIAVIRESGGVARRLYSAEAHKTDSGSIRPSLEKSIIDLWRVYGFLTVIFAAAYVGMGMPIFDSILHAFSGISTGGFSTQSASLAAYSSSIQITTIVLMFLGGVNFVLLYRLMRSDYRPILKNSEFRLYSLIFFLIGGMMSLELILGGSGLQGSLIDGFFQSASVLSSTGYSTTSIMSLSILLQVVFLGLMFVGGSLGSTAGGWKVFRLKTMIELLKTRLRAYSLPESAINEVKIDGELLDNSAVRTISVLFFTWVSVIFLTTMLVLVIEDTALMPALSGTISAAGNMGPVYMHNDLITLNPVTKFIWLIVMLAGRLEMLPVLAIFNTELFKNS